MSVSPAPFLVNKHDTILLPLIDCLSGACGKAGRVRAVVAYTGKRKCPVIGPLAGALVLLPVGSPFWHHLFTLVVGPYARCAGGVMAFAGIKYLFIIVLPGDAIVVFQIRVFPLPLDRAAAFNLSICPALFQN